MDNKQRARQLLCDALNAKGYRPSLSGFIPHEAAISAIVAALEQAGAVEDYLPDGTDIEWQDSPGQWFSGRIIGYHVASYDAELVDGTRVNGYARGRFRRKAPQPAPAAVAGGEHWDTMAYKSACDAVEEWQRRALDAEATIQRMTDAFNAENGPTHMGEPVLAAQPAAGESPRDPSHAWPAVDRVLIDAYNAGADGVELDMIEARRKIDEAVGSAAQRPGAGDVDGTHTATPCHWIEDTDSGAWDTACGQKHQFTAGDATDNGHSFCPYCGGRLFSQPATVEPQP